MCHVHEVHVLQSLPAQVQVLRHMVHWQSSWARGVAHCTVSITLLTLATKELFVQYCVVASLFHHPDLSC
jgi:hypothetical protein